MKPGGVQLHGVEPAAVLCRAPARSKRTKEERLDPARIHTAAYHSSLKQRTRPSSSSRKVGGLQRSQLPGRDGEPIDRKLLREVLRPGEDGALFGARPAVSLLARRSQLPRPRALQPLARASRGRGRGAEGRGRGGGLRRGIGGALGSDRPALRARRSRGEGVARVRGRARGGVQDRLGGGGGTGGGPCTCRSRCRRRAPGRCRPRPPPRPPCCLFRGVGRERLSPSALDFKSVSVWALGVQRRRSPAQKLVDWSGKRTLGGRGGADHLEHDPRPPEMPPPRPRAPGTPRTGPGRFAHFRGAIAPKGSNCSP